MVENLGNIFDALKWERIEMENILTKLWMESSDKISFDQFINIMSELEKNLEESNESTTEPIQSE